MKEKFAIVGAANVGKTTMLRMFIYLLVTDSNFKQITVYRKSGQSLLPRKSFNKSTLNLANLFKQRDMRVVIEWKKITIAVCTGGDTLDIVKCNWTLFNNKLPKQDYDICVSPCHSVGGTLKQEQQEYESRHKGNNSLKYIGKCHYFLLKSAVSTNLSPTASSISLSDMVKQDATSVLFGAGTIDSKIIGVAAIRASHLFEYINNIY